jgi:hypothetical protein
MDYEVKSRNRGAQLPPELLARLTELATKAYSTIPPDRRSALAVESADQFVEQVYHE